MYNPSEFLKKYTELEDWAATVHDDGVMGIEKYHHDRRIQKDMTYFRGIRNVLTHNPNGTDNPLIELTDEFKVRFEELCNKLMCGISDIYVPFKEIYKREMSDKVLPTIKVMKDRKFSYVPVMNGKKIWGIFGESTVFNMIGAGDPSISQENLQLFNIAKYITAYTEDGSFEFMRSDSSVDDVRKMFSDSLDDGRRLDVIYFTTTGDKNGDLVGLITVWDLPSF